MNRLRIALIGVALYALVSVMPAWAVWEGNAGIAAATEFPSAGYFAKSDMFPKNTLVEIENLESGIVIRLVVTGSSGVPGLVAMLSPEAAAALNVKTGSVSRVRISIPSPVAEPPASGTISGGSGVKTLDPDVNPETAALEADALAGTGKAATVGSGVVSAVAAGMGGVGAAETGSAVAAIAGAGETAAAPGTSEIPETDPANDVPLATIVEPSSDPLVPLDSIAEEPLAAVNESPASSENPVTYESPEPLESAPDIPSETSTVSSAFFDEPELTVPESVEVEEPLPVFVPAVATEPEPEAMPTVSDNVPVPENNALTDGLMPEPDFLVTETDPETAIQEGEIAPEPELMAETKSETETLITLEPAEMMPPPAPDAVVASTIPEAPAVITAPIVTTSVLETELNNAVISGLEKGKYYVQIASYSDAANVTKLIDKWGEKYPIAVEKSGANDRTTLKVYVGPVNRDEYGAVLERFRQAGFRDAFVKQAK